MKFKYSSYLCGLSTGVFLTIVFVMVLNDSGRLSVIWRSPSIVNRAMHIMYGMNSLVPRQYNTSYDYRDDTNVLVYVHVQKTGGSVFLRHLVSVMDGGGRRLCYPLPLSMEEHVQIKRDIVLCPYKDVAPNITKLPEMWLVAEKTFGWICGPHPLLSELQKCVPDYYSTHYGPRERRYHFTTILRHPVMRTISEFIHIQRGAKWTYLHSCQGHIIGPDYMPPCYPGYYNKEKWAGLTLEAFLSCKTNWAHNRQTIALADIASADCLDRVNGDRLAQDSILLESAKYNLREMPYFALTEYMVESGALLEHSLGMRLRDPIVQKQVKHLHSNELARQVWSDKDLFNRIAEVNHLDMQLYQYALGLFKERLTVLNMTINKNALQELISLYKSI